MFKSFMGIDDAMESRVGNGCLFRVELDYFTVEVKTQKHCKGKEEVSTKTPS